MSNITHLSTQLSSLGWNLSPEGIESLNLQSVKEITEAALNKDLKEIGNFVLPVKWDAESNVSTPIVLQIKSVKNVSVSKNKSSFMASNSIFKFRLTDGGKGSVVAINVFPLKLKEEQCAPGVKIMLREPLSVVNGILLCKKDSLIFLGGVVPFLFDKWKMSQKYQNVIRSKGKGPPPWIPFSLNNEENDLKTKDKTFLQKEREKSTKNSSQKPEGEKGEEEEEKKEFETLRQGAINEAKKGGGGASKVFGGGKIEIKKVEEERLNSKVFRERRKPPNARRENYETSLESKAPESYSLQLQDFLSDKIKNEKPETKTTGPLNKEKMLIVKASNDGDFGEWSNSVYNNENDESRRRTVKYSGHKSTRSHGTYDKSENESRIRGNGFRNGRNVKTQHRTQVEHHSANTPLTENRDKQYSRNQNKQRFRGGRGGSSHLVSESREPHFSNPPLRGFESKALAKNSNPNKYKESKNNLEVQEMRNDEKRTNLSSSFAHPSPSSHRLSTTTWRIGDEGYAKYWEDNLYYPIKVMDTTSNTALVFFVDYDNYEEVLFTDLKKKSA